MPQDPRLAGIGEQHGGEHPDQRGLPRTVRPEQPEDGAVGHREVDGIDGQHLAEPPGQPTRGDGGLGEQVRPGGRGVGSRRLWYAVRRRRGGEGHVSGG